MFQRYILFLFAFVCVSFAQTPLPAQEIYSYQLIPRTVYEKEPVKVTRWIDETVMEKRQVTEYRAITQTETRERKRTTYKPIRRTVQREVTTTEYKPVTETRYRTRRSEETVMEEETRYRDEQVTIRVPVIETETREERVTVRKPVTQQLIEVKRTTTYKPVFRESKELVPAELSVPATLNDPNQRYRLQRLDSGYYTDPETGYSVYRRRGLHWTKPPGFVELKTPALIERSGQKIEYVPETTEERKPVEVTRMVDEVQTRKVPVEVRRMVEKTETHQVPYTVRVPKTRVIIDEIPYTETRYEEQTVTKKVPITETTYQRVVTTEPYEVEVNRWVPVTREIEVPKVVQRKVEYEYMRDVPRTVTMKVPLDFCGNPLGPPVPYDSPTPPTIQNSRAITPTNNGIIRFGDLPSATNSATSTTTRRLPLSSTEVPQTNYRADYELVPGYQMIDRAGGKSVLTDGEIDDDTDRVSTMKPIVEAGNGEPADPNTFPEIEPPKATQPDSTPSDVSGDENAEKRVGDPN